MHIIIMTVHVFSTNDSLINPAYMGVRACDAFGNSEFRPEIVREIEADSGHLLVQARV